MYSLHTKPPDFPGKSLVFRVFTFLIDQFILFPPSLVPDLRCFHVVACFVLAITFLSKQQIFTLGCIILGMPFLQKVVGR